MRTAVYVDGFNLYHSALEARPEFRWLNLHAMAAAALDPEHEIVLVRYFTAPVKGSKDDQGGPQRQDAYIRALRVHCPLLSVHFGRFVQREKWKRLVEPLGRTFTPCPEKVLTWHREEKGSDVNLGVHLLNDAWLGRYDCAVLVSDDSDLAEPLSLVCDMGLHVILLSPIALQGRAGRTPNTAQRFPARELQKYAHAFRHLSVKHLSTAQLPETVVNGRGKTFRRPASWVARP